MKPTHTTPGPWKYTWENDSRDWAIVTDANGRIVANVNTETCPDITSAPAFRQMPAEANAQLIASAPDMLEALHIIARSTDEEWANGHVKTIARSVILNATGAQS